MPVGNQIVCDTEQPSREGQSSILVTVQLVQGAIEGARSQVLGIMHVADPVIDVGVDAIYIPLIQYGKRIGVRLRQFNQRRLGTVIRLCTRSATVGALLRRSDRSVDCFPVDAFRFGSLEEIRPVEATVWL